MRIENARVLVTGGAGFIGGHLVDRLRSAGNEVVVVDDFSSGKEANLAHHKSGVTVHRADIFDERALYPLFRGVDFVFHLACRNVRLSLRRPTEVHDVNATGTLNVLKASAAAGVQGFLYCSSSEVNGTADVVPMPERYHFAPETIYGASKLTGEYYTSVFQRSGWLSTVIARPHNNYGPREHYEGFLGEVIPRFILWAMAGKPLVVYGDGRQTRDFTYVTETADYLVRLLECDAARGGTFNVCRGQEHSILDIVAALSDAFGRELEVRHLPGRPSDVLRLYGDPSRLRGVLGDSPSISLREGLGWMVRWFGEHVVVDETLLSTLAPCNWESVESEEWMRAVDSRRG